MRYCDPAKARWISRDPIEEEGGLGLYAYVANEPVGRADYLGREDASYVTDKTRANCAGGALGDGYYIEPAAGKSWKDVAESHGFGDFKKVTSSAQCDTHCGCRRKAVIMYVPKYPTGKDPFVDAFQKEAEEGEGFEDPNGDWVYDVHFAGRGAYGGSRPEFPWKHTAAQVVLRPGVGPASHYNFVATLTMTVDAATGEETGKFEPADPDTYVLSHYKISTIASMHCMCKGTAE